MNKFKLLLGALLLTGSQTVLGQGAKNIVISEVVTCNESGIVDEFGQREAWIELENTSYTTYNVRGMFITTNPKVLDKSLSAPERISLMSVIPSGEKRTSIGARQHLMLFGNSSPAQGKLHLSVQIPDSAAVWIALYNGNGVELIDSVSVPALGADHSYARTARGWVVKTPSQVTPGIENTVGDGVAVKTGVEKFKEQDPYGFAMAIMAMGSSSSAWPCSMASSRSSAC